MTAASGRGIIALVVAATLSCGFPVFLISALYLQISHDLGAPITALGAIVATYWLGAALVSSSAGTLARLIGTRRLVMLAVGLAVTSLVGSSLVVSDWGWLFLWSAVGGASNALGQPGSNQLIANGIRLGRRASAYGIKQAAVPLTSLAAGLAVPALALTIGWHWAFVLAAVFAAALVAVFATTDRESSAAALHTATVAKFTRPQLTFLVLIGCISVLGAGASTAAVTFAVTAAAHRGMDITIAALLLSLGSLGGGIMRIAVGVLADRGWGGTLRTIAIMQGIGACGLFVMAIQSQLSFALGFLVVAAFGWGWPGLLHYFVSKTAGASAAAATGIFSIGNYAGNALGPLLLGLTYSQGNDTVSWLLVGLSLAIAAVIAWSLSRQGAPRAFAATTS